MAAGQEHHVGVGVCRVVHGVVGMVDSRCMAHSLLHIISYTDDFSPPYSMLKSVIIETH